MDIRHRLFLGALLLLSIHNLVAEPSEKKTVSNQLLQILSFRWIDEHRDHQKAQGCWSNADLSSIVSVAGHVWETQNQLHNKTTTFDSNVVALIFDKEMFNIVTSLENIIANSGRHVSFLHFMLQDDNHNKTIENSLNYLGNINQINSVFLLTGNESSSSALYLLDYVSLNVIFKWTSLIHTTEWTIVTTNLNGLDTLASVAARAVDFLTFIAVRPGQNVTIAQKSRKQNLTMVSSLNWFGHSAVTAGRVCTTKDSFIESIERRIDLLYKRGKLRANAGSYLQSQKSVLDGMHFPVSVFVTGDKLVYTNNVNNNSTMELDGYCIALLKLFASSMEFTYDYLMVSDGGFYGAVEEDRVTGILGHLVRREAAFSPIPLSVTENRMGKMDYIPVPMATGKTSFIYRLHRDSLDATYLYIFSQDFLLLCLGPALVAGVIGAFLHVTTNSCTQAAPHTIAFHHLRRLSTFPEHICLHAATPVSQSSRVLTASWSVMCFVCVSAYSAYLTSAFTVTSPELTIKTFKDLLEAKDYEFGMHQSISALKTLMETSEDPYLKRAWDLLVERNETDPSVLSCNNSFHFERVITDRYVCVALAAFRPNESRYRDDVRMYNVDGIAYSGFDYICTPTNVFYTEEFYSFTRRFLESKANHILLDKYKISAINNRKQVRDNNNIIQFSRIQLSVYGGLCGAGISIVCLLVELVCHRCGVVKSLDSKLKTKSGFIIVE